MREKIAVTQITFYEADLRLAMLQNAGHNCDGGGDFFMAKSLPL